MFNCVILPLIMINMSYMIDQPLCLNQEINMYNDSYIWIQYIEIYLENNITFNMDEKSHFRMNNCWWVRKFFEDRYINVTRDIDVKTVGVQWNRI